MDFVFFSDLVFEFSFPPGWHQVGGGGRRAYNPHSSNANCNQIDQIANHMRRFPRFVISGTAISVVSFTLIVNHKDFNAHSIESAQRFIRTFHAVTHVVLDYKWSLRSLAYGGVSHDISLCRSMSPKAPPNIAKRGQSSTKDQRSDYFQFVRSMAEFMVLISAFEPLFF